VGPAKSTKPPKIVQTPFPPRGRAYAWRPDRKFRVCEPIGRLLCRADICLAAVRSGWRSAA
jgi:hypothetical protein